MHVNITTGFLQQITISNTNNFSKYASRAYNFIVKRISRGLNLFNRKIKDAVSLPTRYIGPSLSRGHPTVTIMNLNIYRNARGTSSHTLLMVTTARLVVTILNPINLVNGLLIVCSRLHVEHEMLWPRGKCLVRRIWT